jgi:hypothetical protein
LEDAPGEKTLEVYHGSPTGVGKIATRKRRILMIISSKWSSKKWGDLPNKSLLSLSLFLCVCLYCIYHSFCWSECSFWLVVSVACKKMLGLIIPNEMEN